MSLTPAEMPEPDADARPSFHPISASHAVVTVWSDVTLLSFLALSAILPYYNTLANGFVYDDHAQILNNPYILSFRHLGRVFSSGVWSYAGAPGPANYYRPLMTLGYLLCFQLFGAAPFGFHLANVLLHAAVVCVMFIVGRRLLHDRTLAFIAAALFALLPIHSESVAWVAAVTDLELTFFFLLAFGCSIALGGPKISVGVRLGRQLAMILSYALALLSKEQAVVLPVLAAIYEHAYRPERREINWWQKVSRYIGLWIVAGLYLVFRFRMLGGLASAGQRSDLTRVQTLLSAVALGGSYLVKLIWPIDLSVFYPFHKSVGLLDPRVLWGAASLAGCAVLFMALWRRWRVMSFGLLWFFFALSPVLNAKWLAPTVFAERYLYLPSVGFCWLAAGLAGKAWKLTTARSSAWRWAMWTGAFILATLCFVRILARNQQWKNDETLYQATLAFAPDAYQIRTNLGSYYWDRGDVERARQEWLVALKDAPESSLLLNNLGLVCANQKQYTEAEAFYERALRVNPNDADVHINLGVAYQESGQMNSAERQFQAAADVAPLNYHARNRLGSLYLASNRLRDAEKEFYLSLQSAANVVAWDGMGDIALRNGDRVSAERDFRAALAMNRRDSHALIALGDLDSAAGHRSQAMAEYQAGLAIDPNSAAARRALQRLKAIETHANSTRP